MNKPAMVLAVLLTATSACHAREATLVLSPESLAAAKDRLVGRLVQVDGCVYVHEHGMQVAPCGKHGWNQITLAVDPNNLVYPAFDSVGRFPFGALQARFRGRMVEQEYEGLEHRVRPTLRIEGVSKVQRHGL